MRDHPACQELVVPRVELVLPQPVVVGEAMQELWVLQDDGPVRSSPSRQTRNAAVNVCRRGDLDIPDGQPEGSEDLPDRHAVADGLHALRRADTTDFLVLKAGEDVGEEGRGPDGVIVGEDHRVEEVLRDGGVEPTDESGVDGRPLPIVFHEAGVHGAIDVIPEIILTEHEGTPL